MKKKKFLYVLIPIMVIVIVHLLFAYANWEINPANWSESVRTDAAIIYFFGLIAAFLITMVINEEF